MFSKLLSYFRWDTQNSNPSLEDAYQVLDFSLLNTPQPEEEPAGKEVINACEHKIGTITNVSNETITIDNIYEFKWTDEKLPEVGTQVSYTIFNQNNIFKVTNVKEYCDNWQEAPAQQTTWCTRNIVCEVVRRDGRVIIVEPKGLRLDLNYIAAEFIPVVGDWLDLEIKSEIDEEVANLNGAILEVTKIRALRENTKECKVTAFNNNTFVGVLNNNIYFNKESLTQGYLPKIGDFVVAHIIESNQTTVCNWRALKLIFISTQGTSHHINLEIPTLIQYERNVEDVAITDDIKITSDRFNQLKHFQIVIKNCTKDVIVLKDIKFDSVNSQVKLKSSKFIEKDLQVDTWTIVEFFVNAKIIGQSKEVVIFVFEKFNIGREIAITLTCNENYNNYNNRRYNNNQHRQGNNSNKFTPNMRNTAHEIIRGQGTRKAHRFINKIGDYKVPESLWKIYDKFETEDVKFVQIRNELSDAIKSLNDDLNFNVYDERFHVLLFLEEIKVNLALRKYDQPLACFIKNGEYLMLEIENLNESRPSILTGDSVLASNPANLSTVYEGIVHKVSDKHLYLKFTPMMHDTYKGEDYSIMVKQTRGLYRKLHHAVDFAVKNLGKEILFPTCVPQKTPQVNLMIENYNNSNGESVKKLKPSQPRRTHKEVAEFIKTIAKNNASSSSSDGELNGSSDPDDETKIKSKNMKLEWFDKGLNFYQKEAVRNVLLGEARPLPYVIFGPPGTGKTITIVETILQILKMMPQSRILVGTPSNSAANLVTERLIDSASINPGDLVRLVSHRCVADDLIPVKLIPYSATGSIAREGTFDKENLVQKNGLRLDCTSSVIGRHRVTVSTCGSIGTMHQMNFTKGHFTHIIIDEAGQCTEPEIMIPMSLIDVNEGQIILAGDPMQLGPISVSREAREFGLSDSYLERLLNRFPYIRDPESFPKFGGYDQRLVTRLVYNYRSLPGILKIPNELFYHAELKPTISETDSEEATYLSSLAEMLPCVNDKVPSMVFHGLHSENLRSGDSPSWFNPDEASQIFYYVNELYRLGVKASDIGIISPYIKQVKHIRAILQEAEFDIPKIGTVEEFQGQEFKVILISTVRSNCNLINNDLRFSLGFLSNPQRLNVSLTRACCLSIIVGNAVLLSRDMHWRRLLLHCMAIGSYVGCKLNVDSFEE